MAIFGWGASALVAAWLVQTAVMLVASYALKPHAVRPLFWYADAASAIGIGRAVFLTNIVNWMLNNLDRVLIGRHAQEKKAQHPGRLAPFRAVQHPHQIA